MGSKRKFSIFEVLVKFGRGLEEPRSDKIYSSGNQGVKKGPGPRGSRDEEFLMPSLILTHQKKNSITKLTVNICTTANLVLLGIQTYTQI